MSRSSHPLSSTHGAMALFCIEWLIEDRLILPPALGDKLAVPASQLHRVLGTLTAHEQQDLRRSIAEAARSGTLPGPLRSHELFTFLDSLAETTPDGRHAAAA